MLYRSALNADELAATTNASEAAVLHASLEVYASLEGKEPAHNRAQSMSELTVTGGGE